MENRLLTVEQVADRLSMTIWTIRHWLRIGKLAGSKTGKEWRIAEKDLDAFVEARKNTATA